MSAAEELEGPRPQHIEAAPGDGKDAGVKDGTERRKLKNEDSSYDSDFDPCDSSPRQDDGHEDVSRTASETLAAEFEDYVTHPQPLALSLAGITQVDLPQVAQHLPPTLSVTEATPTSFVTPSFPAFSSSKPSAPPTHSEDPVVSPFSGIPLSCVLASEEYPQQVEFGVKLGYSESLVQLALTKLGVNPDKNELLDELIRLGAGAPKSDGDSESPEEEPVPTPGLRPIIIDGSNVAMSHGGKTKFSCKGIRLCVDWFRARGHKEIIAFVPLWRKEPSRPDAVITDQDILQDLEKEGVLYFTPSRSCGGKRIISYDDRYIIKEALNWDGVIVSNDNYRDLAAESPAFKRVTESSILMYSWVGGRFEPPDDPLGRNGPSLEAFLRKYPSGVAASVAAKDSRPCPYGKKCTYGNKCKYMHPERGAAPIKSVTEILQEKKEKHYQHKAKSRDSSPGEGLRAKSLSLPVGAREVGKKPLARTQSNCPSISATKVTANKDRPISEFAITTKADSTHQLPVTTQSSLDSICNSLLKGSDSNMFNYCSKQRPQMGLGMPWSPIDSTSQSSINLSLGQRISEHHDLSIENLHPKLERQLSINPGGDDRLSKISKQLIRTGAMPSVPLHQQLLQSQSHPDEYSHTFGNRDVLQTYLHQPITRHSSAQETTHVSSYSQQMMMSPFFHSPVGRNLSAPDQLRCGSQQPQQPQNPSMAPHITRINSTSDSRLNIHDGGSEFFSDCFTDAFHRLSYFQQPPGPIGSRPMSPQQPLNSLLPSQSLAGTRIPQYLPTQSSSMGILHPQEAPGGNTHEDERLKIFYHLSQLFPEAQVRSALARNPDETDPTKICMSILVPSGGRPLSPSQSLGTPTGMPLGNGSTLPQRGASYSSPQVGMDSARESARIEAYTNLAQVFPEEQVRNVLLAYPEETDPTKLCMLLMVLNCPGGGATS